MLNSRSVSCAGMPSEINGCSWGPSNVQIFVRARKDDAEALRIVADNQRAHGIWKLKRQKSTNLPRQRNNTEVVPRRQRRVGMADR